MAEFFSLASTYSRFWLPSLLHEFAKIPPTFCRGDGCSIFLVHGNVPRLHLAATTRGEMRPRLFDESYHYSVDKARLLLAAERWLEERETTNDASLTGWVVAFDRPLLINNLHDDKELEQVGSRLRVPRPVWSYKNRGPQDHNTQVARPFLCVPMHAPKHGVVGAIRVATSSRAPESFDEDDQRKLQDFADALGCLLQESGMLDARGLEHFFRIWGAEDVAVLGEAITQAVPALFDVECCSLFLRDPFERFVLRNAASRLPGDHFQKFLAGNRGNVFYRRGDESKTSLCIESQRPVILMRDSEWRIETPHRIFDGVPLRLASGGGYLGSVPSVLCECPHDDTKSILLVPVRDVLSAHLPAGVLRIVSREKILDPSRVVTEILHFADDLAGVIGKTWQADLQRRARQDIVTQLAGRHTPYEQKLQTAAKIICTAINAGAVTIFTRMRDSQLLVTKPEYAVLADRYRENEGIQQHHEAFKQHRETYEDGLGRTGWVARNNKVLNLKNLHDRKELEEYDIRDRPVSLCELENVGPFLAAPISKGPDSKCEVVGVIRAVRRLQSTHGAFSVAHEEILAACGAMLATVLESARWKAVVSYCTQAMPTLVIVRRWIEKLGGECLALVDRSSSEPVDNFRELLNRADCGVVIMTDDDNGKPSESVHDEAVLMLAHPQVGAHRIILRTDRVDYRTRALPGAGAKEINFSRDPGGIHGVHEEFSDAVKELISPGTR